MSKESENRRLPPVSELLPLGYVYLLILGIANQSLFYGLVGVNFLAWSDALDVLISPIALLTGDPRLLVTLVVLTALLYPYVKWIQALARKQKLAKGEPIENEAPLLHAWLVYSSIVLIFGFIGFAASSGQDLRQRLVEGEARIDHRIEFHDGRSVAVELVGKNTGFLFYFAPGDTALSIAPLADNVHRVVRLSAAATAAAEVLRAAPAQPPSG